MKEPVKKLLLVIPIRVQEDLTPVLESEGWHTIKDLFRKTGTSYNTHWNGNYVLDQDEIPWKATPEEVDALEKTKGCVVVLNETKYQITEKVILYADKDGSVYVVEEDVASFLEA
ncbi:MAG TPA: hypothetical protein VK463_19060 [Desulfomonilaceae bacterium]|nr:hypothetical protein [Desulfomonilaceae bacterium]